MGDKIKTNFVDIDLLFDMLNESKKGRSISDIICILEMCDVPMSDVVRRLGVCSGELDE